MLRKIFEPKGNDVSEHYRTSHTVPTNLVESVYGLNVEKRQGTQGTVVHVESFDSGGLLVNSRFENQALGREKL